MSDWVTTSLVSTLTTPVTITTTTTPAGPLNFESILIGDHQNHSTVVWEVIRDKIRNLILSYYCNSLGYDTWHKGSILYIDISYLQKSKYKFINAHEMAS